jgi:hypothetical protein
MDDRKLIAARNWRWVGEWHPPMSLPCVGATGIDSCHTEESIRAWGSRDPGKNFRSDVAETCPHCGHIRARRDQIYRSNEPRKIVATYDTDVAVDHRLADMLDRKASSYMEHVMKHDWKDKDRVRVLRGEHEGRTGTVMNDGYVTAMATSFFKIGEGQVLVALDGEPGEVSAPGRVAHGGRGGMPIVIANDDLEPYDGPPGRSVGKDRR